MANRMYTKEAMTVNAIKGIKWLGKKYPKELPTIDAVLLSMPHVLNCALGQCHRRRHGTGNFDDAVKEHVLSVERQTELGLMLHEVAVFDWVQKRRRDKRWNEVWADLVKKAQEESAVH